MYSIKKYNDKFEMYELKEESTMSWIKVCPERGGIITSFGVNGKELLYLDKESFYDSNANIRGGIPILFPVCGQLKDGEYNLNGKIYFMKNHGFARISTWEAIETNIENQALIRLELKSNKETKKIFPFDFQLIFTYILKNGELTIKQEYKNISAEPMPIYAGFHPYFKAKSKNLIYETDATQYLDYNDMEVKSFEGAIDLNKMVESAAFIDFHRNNISFKQEELDKNINLEYGKEFKYIVLWSVKDKDFVCVEPWMALSGAFNTGENLVFVKPKETLSTYIKIS
jgi:galactose mutarotase-like enzyme